MDKGYEGEPIAGAKNKIVVLTGVSASGKDFVIERFRESYPNIGEYLDVVNFGEMLFRNLQGKGFNLKSRDRLASEASNEVVRIAIAELLDRLVLGKPKLINTHVAYKQQGSIQINPDVCKKLNPETYLFIWAEPELIIKWRRGSLRFRERALEDVSEVALHQQIAMEATRAIALAYGSGFRTIINQEDNIQSSVGSLQEVVAAIL